MKIAIFSATGPLGRKVVSAAQDAGHSVRLLTRRASSAEGFGPDVEVVVGDYFDAEAVAETLQGAHAVLSTIGPPQKRISTPGPSEFSSAMAQLIAELEAQGIQRIVTVASMGTRLPGEGYGPVRLVFRLLLSRVAPVVIPTKEAELRLLSESSLSWTALRPPIIRKVKRSRLTATGDPSGWQVDGDALAAYMVGQLTDTTWHRRAPFVQSR